MEAQIQVHELVPLLWFAPQRGSRQRLNQRTLLCYLESLALYSLNLGSRHVVLSWLLITHVQDLLADHFDDALIVFAQNEFSFWTFHLVYMTFELQQDV